MPLCPKHKNIKELSENLPEEYPQIVEEYNKPCKFTNDLMVGHGSGVSPFCAIHQTLRSAAGVKIKVDSNSIQVIQLGCKGGDGKKSISDDLCQIAEVERKTVEKQLDNGMCVYMIKILEND